MDSDHSVTLGPCLEDPYLMDSKLIDFSFGVNFTDHRSVTIYLEMQPSGSFASIENTCLLFCNFFDEKTKRMEYLGCISMDKRESCILLWERVYHILSDSGKDIEFSLLVENPKRFEITSNMATSSVNEVKKDVENNCEVCV